MPHGLGMTTVLDHDGRLLGIFTAGDLRRMLEKQLDFHTTAIADVMTRGPRTCRAGILAAEAMRVMEQAKISQLVVVDAHDAVVGALNMHDMLRAGVV